MNTRNAPAKDIDPSELWVKLTELPRPTSQRMTFRARGKDVGEYVFWVLTASELSSVRSRADKETRATIGDEASKAGNIAYEEEYELQKACQLLQLAMRQPDSVIFPAFMTAKDVRQALTDDEIAVAMIGYGTFRRESGPIRSELSIEEMDALATIIAKDRKKSGGGLSRAALANMSEEAMADMIVHLVDKLIPSVAEDTAEAAAP